MNDPIYGILMEVEGKNLKQDVIDCLDHLQRVYVMKPLFCWAGVKEAQIIDGLEVVPNPTVNKRNLMFMYEDNPRKKEADVNS